MNTTVRPAENAGPKAVLRLSRRPDGHLMAMVDGKEVPVMATRCFPWSEPNRFISLRNPDDTEVALVEHPSDLDDESRGFLEQALIEAGFIFRVQKILSVEEEFEIRSWKVETQEGVRSFQTARDEWPAESPGGGFLLRDVAGDLFHLPEPDEMDELSQKLLWSFID